MISEAFPSHKQRVSVLGVCDALHHVATIVPAVKWHLVDYARTYLTAGWLVTTPVGGKFRSSRVMGNVRLIGKGMDVISAAQISAGELEAS